MTHGHAGADELPLDGPVALVVGPGDRFLSGVSYYTALLTAALAERGTVAALLLRRLCPRIFYPGRARVGSTEGALPLPSVPVFNGLDWFWGLSALGAWRFWRRNQPAVVVLQWWTATVLHSYLAIAWRAKRSGARLVIEFHEMQDVGEAKLPLVSRYTRIGMRRLLKFADAIVVHSDFDRTELCRAYPELVRLPIEVIAHGPYTHHGADSSSVPCDGGLRDANGPLRVLIFGVVRPYKGHAELAGAVRILVESGLDIHLSVIGEVWQGYREPLDELRGILPDDRLTIVDRYVDDDEVPDFFAGADLVVLPYRRSSASGPLHTAMSSGLPVVTTSVGGLVEAVNGYTGAVLVPPADPCALADGIRAAIPLIGITHEDPHSWQQSAESYSALMESIGVDWGRAGQPVVKRTTRVGSHGEVA